MKRGDVVSISPQTHWTWILMSPQEIQELRDRDIKEGRWHDDAGESILYGPYRSAFPMSTTVPVSTSVLITSLRPKWVGHSNRPKGLVAGLFGGTGYEVLFTSRI